MHQRCLGRADGVYILALELVSGEFVRIMCARGVCVGAFFFCECAHGCVRMRARLACRSLLAFSTTVTSTTITITPDQTVTVAGVLVLLDNSTVTVQYNPKKGAPITVSGAISLNGALAITLPGSIANGTIIPLISGSGTVDGGFDTVTVSGRSCQALSGRLVSDRGGFGVLVTVESDKCKSGRLSTVRVCVHVSCTYPVCTHYTRQGALPASSLVL